jgi:hypothetical protein
VASPNSAACSRKYRAVRTSGTRNPATIRLIVLHDEESATAESAAQWFANPKAQGSAHLCVDDLVCFRTLNNEDIPWAAQGANERGFHIEQAGFARWSAVVVGFIGVLMIVQPDTHGIEPAMLLAVIAAILVGARDLSNRGVPAHVPVFLIVFAASLANMLGGAFMIVAETQSWVWPSLHQTMLILCAGAFVLASTALITFSFRGTEISAVSPFRYIGVPVALLLGLFVWGDTPNLLASLGIGLVVGAGLFAMRDEAMRSKSR